MFRRFAPISKSTVRFFSTKNPATTPVIVAAQRTPIGSFQGALATFSATKLGSLAIKSAIQQAGISNSDVQEVFMGNVVSAGLGQAPATQASINAGLPNSIPTTTVNKVCASGMKATIFGAQTILTGQLNCVVTGGMESMSNIPYYSRKARTGIRLGHDQLEDGILIDGLTDAFSQKHMGVCGDLCAKSYGFSREDQDKYAIESYRRSEEATKNGYFKGEMFSVSYQHKKKGTITVAEDEEYKNIQLEKVPKLSPAFGKEGTVTAANASKLSDGACALVIMSEEKAKRIGIKPLARIIGFADAARAPEEFSTAPALAIPKALTMAGLKKSDVDYWEINEAFSVVALANAKILDLDLATVNVFGGAVSLGHPIGCSGARIIATLISVLKHKNAKIGCAGICNGGGGASSIVLERLD